MSTIPQPAPPQTFGSPSTLGSPYDLVIFDMDGTLVDTEPHYRAVNRQLFNELGFDLPVAEHDGLVGMTAEGIWGHLKTRFDLALPVTELIALEQHRQWHNLQLQTLMPIAGVPELVEAIGQQGLQRAVGSSSPQFMIDFIVEKIGLKAAFDTTLSGEAVAHGKPAPDLFLALAAHFQRDPARCLVLEDARHGVSSAKAAGMTCWGYQNPHSGYQDLSAADFVFSDYAEALRHWRDVVHAPQRVH
jgi:HAD superfamily hydrolase (TIGR01509 family)